MSRRCSAAGKLFAGESQRMQLALDSAPEKGLRIAANVALEE